MKLLTVTIAEETRRIGYVYPDNEESFYYSSNLRKCEAVECVDGYYYAELNEE